MKSNKIVTIITPSYNLIKAGREKTFRECVESVHNQTYKHIEHLIIDGASNDGTLNLIKEYEDKGWIKCYSEPDRGIYDAMNKGILKAQGKYVVCLNSDDYYCDDQAVEALVKLAEEENADACYANSRVLFPNGDLYFLWYGNTSLFPPFGQIPNHQTFMIKTDVMKELNLYNLDYKMSADSNFVYKMIKNNKKMSFLDKFVVVYRKGGASSENADQVHLDQENSFLEYWGEELNLSPKEVHMLSHNHFKTLELQEAIKLGAKLKYPEWVEEYFRRLISHRVQIALKNSVKTPQKQTPQKQTPQEQTKKYYLFNFIPLFKIKGEENKRKYYLFNFIPLLKIRNKKGKIKYSLFNFIPLFKIKGKESKKKYYLFNFIPLLKIKKK